MTIIGYSTDFWGEVTTDRPVDEETYQLLVGLNQTRRMKRDSQKLAKRLKIKVADVVEKYGPECSLWVGDAQSKGQERTPDIVDYNTPPSDQPGLWCQWTMLEDHQTIQWDEGEKFYEYITWMKYLIDKVLKPRGYIVNGEIEWRGEDPQDTGILCVENNRVGTKEEVSYYLFPEDAVRVRKIIDDYLANPLKEVVDESLDKK